MSLASVFSFVHGPLMWPQFDPVAVQLGPLAVHWYGLSYVVGLLGALQLAKYLAGRYPAAGVTPARMEDLFGWVVAGVIGGGRLGYVLFYGGVDYIYEPWRILMVWQGGMSFHGGLLGVVLAGFWFCRKHGLNMLDVGDRVAPAVPFGLALGRLANFINGELWGRPADPSVVPWAMIFPHVDMVPRHPSQLYELGLEGVVLMAVLWVSVWAGGGPVRGRQVGLFLAGYACARMLVEQFRTPEIMHHVLGLAITQGQTLSVPMLVVGLWLFGRSLRRA